MHSIETPHPPDSTIKHKRATKVYLCIANSKKHSSRFHVLVEGNLRRRRGFHDQTLVLVVRRLDAPIPRHHVSNVQPANSRHTDCFDGSYFSFSSSLIWAATSAPWSCPLTGVSPFVLAGSISDSLRTFNFFSACSEMRVSSLTKLSPHHALVYLLTYLASLW